MTDRTKKVSVLKAAFGTLEMSRDGEDVSVKCPKCAKPGSSKKKLVINLEKGMYHCWVCGIKGRNVVRLVRTVSPSTADHPIFKKWSKSTKLIDESPENEVAEKLNIFFPNQILQNQLTNFQFFSFLQTILYWDN